MRSAKDFRRLADECRRVAREVPWDNSRDILTALACELEAEAWIAEGRSGTAHTPAETPAGTWQDRLEAETEGAG